MAVFSVVKLSELEGAIRLDAEFYRLEYLELYKVLNELYTETINEIALFVKKGIFDISPALYASEGIPFVRVQNIRKGFLEETELAFISEETHQKEIKTELGSYDLVLSKVGTIGEISFIPSKFSRANFSQNVIGIKVNKLKIYSGYFLIFLLSRFGQQQIERVQMPQVQSKLELEPVKSVKVVRLKKDVEQIIHKKVLEAETLYENSKSLYSQAEALLLEELGLKDFKPKYQKTYNAKISEALSARRIDAEYFQPAYEEVVEKVKRSYTRN